MSYRNTIPSAQYMYKEFCNKFKNIEEFIRTREVSIFQIRDEKYDSKVIPVISVECAGYLSSIVMLSNRTKSIIVYCPYDINIPNSEYLVIVRRS